MASTKEFKDYILDQLRMLEGINTKLMMSEYLLYYNDTLFGGIYDDRLLIKIVESNKKYNLKEEKAYDGAKNMYFVDDIDNQELLNDIILDTCRDLIKKKTLFFSNVIGSIKAEDTKFNEYMEEYIINNVDNRYSMIFINAPGLGDEEHYFPSILKCFNRLNISFKNTLYVDKETNKDELNSFIKDNDKIMYFLMGGNPYSQHDIIEKLNIKETLKNHKDIVIGFCAGAINLSKYSIITTDEDFNIPDSFIGIGREEITIEPHYNDNKDEKRNQELKGFSNKYKTSIYCIPDESIIYFEDGRMYKKGEIIIINDNTINI